jgi:hypothetical protein
VAAELDAGPLPGRPVHRSIGGKCKVKESVCARLIRQHDVGVVVERDCLRGERQVRLYHWADVVCLLPGLALVVAVEEKGLLLASQSGQQPASRVCDEVGVEVDQLLGGDLVEGQPGDSTVSGLRAEHLVVLGEGLD